MNYYFIGGAIVIVALIVLAFVLFKGKAEKVAQELIKNEMPIIEKDIPTVLDKLYSDFPKSFKLFVSQKAFQSFIEGAVKDFSSKGTLTFSSAPIISDVEKTVSSDAIKAVDNIAGNVVADVEKSISGDASGNLVSGNNS